MLSSLSFTRPLLYPPVLVVEGLVSDVRGIMGVMDRCGFVGLPTGLTSTRRVVTFSRRYRSTVMTASGKVCFLPLFSVSTAIYVLLECLTKKGGSHRIAVGRYCDWSIARDR